MMLSGPAVSGRGDQPGVCSEGVKVRFGIIWAPFRSVPPQVPLLPPVVPRTSADGEAGRGRGCFPQQRLKRENQLGKQQRGKK